MHMSDMNEGEATTILLLQKQTYCGTVKIISILQFMQT